MSIDLYKLSTITWAVRSSKDDELYIFTSIEDTADFLEDQLKIPSDEIDLALIDMLSKNHSRAQFGTFNGVFIFSDNAKPEEIIGVA